eukprot:gene9515-12422_t
MRRVAFGRSLSSQINAVLDEPLLAVLFGSAAQCLLDVDSSDVDICLLPASAARALTAPSSLPLEDPLGVPSMETGSLFQQLLADLTFVEDFPGLHQPHRLVLRWEVKSEESQQHDSVREKFSFDLSLRRPGLAKSAYICNALQHTPALLPVLRFLLTWLRAHGLVAGGKGPWMHPSSLVLLCLHIWDVVKKGWLRVLPSDGQSHGRCLEKDVLHLIDNACADPSASGEALVAILAVLADCSMLALSNEELLSQTESFSNSGHPPSSHPVRHLSLRDPFNSPGPGSNPVQCIDLGLDQLKVVRQAALLLLHCTAMCGSVLSSLVSPSQLGCHIPGGVAMEILNAKGYLGQRSICPTPIELAACLKVQCGAPQDVQIQVISSAHSLRQMWGQTQSTRLWRSSGGGLFISGATALLFEGGSAASASAPLQLGRTKSDAVYRRTLLWGGDMVGFKRYTSRIQIEHHKFAVAQLVHTLHLVSPSYSMPDSTSARTLAQCPLLPVVPLTLVPAMRRLQALVHARCLTLPEQLSGAFPQKLLLECSLRAVTRFGIFYVMNATHGMGALGLHAATGPGLEAVLDANKRPVSLKTLRKCSQKAASWPIEPKQQQQQQSRSSVEKGGRGGNGIARDKLGKNSHSIHPNRVLSAFATGFKPCQQEEAEAVRESQIRSLSASGFFPILPVWDTPPSSTLQPMPLGLHSTLCGLHNFFITATLVRGGREYKVNLGGHLLESHYISPRAVRVVSAPLLPLSASSSALAASNPSSAGDLLAKEDQMTGPGVQAPHGGPSLALEAAPSEGVQVPHCRFMFELRPAVDDVDTDPFLEALTTRQRIMDVPMSSGSSAQAGASPQAEAGDTVAPAPFPSWARLYNSSAADASGELFRVAPSSQCTASDFLNVRMHHQQCFALGGGRAGSVGQQLGAGCSQEAWHVVVVVDE